MDAYKIVLEYFEKLTNPYVPGKWQEDTGLIAKKWIRL